MNEKLDQMLKQAREIFMRYGLRSVTMDDVCREMGISKKTLYQYVTDKTDLVSKVLELDIKEDENLMCNMQDSQLPAIDELLCIQKMVSEKIKNMHTSIVFDLKKYYPESWAIVMQHRNQFIVSSIEHNIRKGQKEGVFRDDIQPAVIARIYAARIDALIDPSLFQDMNIPQTDIYFEAMKYHIRGIATEKGQKYLNDNLHKTQS